MKSFKTIFVLLFLSSIMLNAQKSIIKELGNFDEVKVYDQLSVTLIKSDKNEAEITGDDIEKVAIANENGLLKVRMEVEKFLDGNETQITIYYAGNLKLIDANEGALITAAKKIDSDHLTIKAQEGSQLDLKIDADNLNAKAVSGSIIKVYGKTNNQDILIRTGGVYNAKELASDRANVKIMAGGKAEINAKDYVNASVNAGGKIEIYGNPKQVKENKTFGGSIVIKK